MTEIVVFLFGILAIAPMLLLMRSRERTMHVHHTHVHVHRLEVAQPMGSPTLPDRKLLGG